MTQRLKDKSSWFDLSNLEFSSPYKLFISGHLQNDELQFSFDSSGIHDPDILELLDSSLKTELAEEWMLNSYLLNKPFNMNTEVGIMPYRLKVDNKTIESSIVILPQSSWMHYNKSKPSSQTNLNGTKAWYHPGNGLLLVKAMPKMDSKQFTKSLFHELYHAIQDLVRDNLKSIMYGGDDRRVSMETDAHIATEVAAIIAQPLFKHIEYSSEFKGAGSFSAGEDKVDVLVPSKVYFSIAGDKIELRSLYGQKQEI